MIFWYPLVNGASVFDIGANVGNYTRAYLDAGARRVVAVEPQAALASELRHRFANETRVDVIRAAAGETIGTATLHICKTAPILSSLVPNKWAGGPRFPGYTWDGGTESVPMVTLDWLIGGYGPPDFLKVDTEGYEPQVFNGLSVAVRWICFEHAAENIEDTAAIMRRLDALSEYGYNLVLVEGGLGRPYFDEWVPSNLMMDGLRQLAARQRLFWTDVYACRADAAGGGIPAIKNTEET